jgi:type IV pilus assembly protein PilV
MRHHHCRKCQRGISLVEVLVAMVILAVGLLSLVVLQGRIQVLQIESYQRSQALLLLNDMANRISLNRNQAGVYVTTMAAPVGVGLGACPTDTSTRQKSDISQWCELLQGASEASAGGKVGAMVGGRGCVEDLGSNQYMVVVAWQGMSPISAPPSSVGCGKDLYNGGPDSPCQNDQCRRAVTTIVRIAPLIQPLP